MNTPSSAPQSPTPAGPHDHLHYGHGMWCNYGYPHGQHRHFVLRWILGLVVLALVFCFGFKLGWLHATLYGGDYGFHHRGYFFEEPMMRSYVPPMAVPDNTMPATPANPTPAPTK